MLRKTAEGNDCGRITATDYVRPSETLSSGLIQSTEIILEPPLYLANSFFSAWLMFSLPGHFSSIVRLCLLQNHGVFRYSYLLSLTKKSEGTTLQVTDLA